MAKRMVQSIINYKEHYEILQGNSSIATYFTKLKSIWDEASGLYSIPTCSCGSSA